MTAANDDAKLNDKVRQILSNCLDINRAAVTDNAKLIDDLGADSLDAVNIQRDIKENLNIELSDSDFNHIVTVNDLIELIYKKAQ